MQELAPSKLDELRRFPPPPVKGKKAEEYEKEQEEYIETLRNFDQGIYAPEEEEDSTPLFFLSYSLRPLARQSCYLGQFWC